MLISVFKEVDTKITQYHKLFADSSINTNSKSMLHQEEFSIKSYSTSSYFQDHLHYGGSLILEYKLAAVASQSDSPVIPVWQGSTP